MSPEPPTCDVCGVLISDERGGDQVLKPGATQPVWVHPTCYFVPRGEALAAFLSLEDPVAADADGWVDLSEIEARRDADGGPAAADLDVGLAELVEARWAERHPRREAYRLTATARLQRGRVSARPQ